MEDITEKDWEKMRIVTVNISLARGSMEPTTIKFRQHEGTTDTGAD